MPSSYSTTLQPLQSPLLSNPFIFSKTYKRNHNNVQPVKQVVLALNLTPKSHGLCAEEVSSSIAENKINWVDNCDGFSIKGGEESLDSKENPCGFQAQEFTDAEKGLSFDDKTDIFNPMRKDGRIWTISDFNDLLMALASANELEIALKLYSEISIYGLTPDSWTFSIMLRCYCKKNDLVEAGQLLDYMIRDGLYPNVATFTIFINSLCRSGRLQKAFEVFDVMGRIGCKPTIQTYNCLLKGLCYVGRVEEAYEMLMNVKKDAMEPDIYSYTAVMDGFCKVGRSSEAMELLDEAMERGLTPNVVTFNTLFNGYSKEGTPMKGISVLNLMKRRNCVPDSISYSTLLNGLMKWGEIRAALRTFKEMINLGFDVDRRMMNTLLRGLCIKSWEEKDMLQDAYQVFEKMKSNISVMDPGTYGMVIRALCIGKKFDEALVHLHHMVSLGHIPRTITFNNVIQALCGERKVEEALLVVCLMYELGKIPSRTSYNILIKKLYQLENSFGACTVYGSALKQGVLPCGVTIHLLYPGIKATYPTGFLKECTWNRLTYLKQESFASCNSSLLSKPHVPFIQQRTQNVF